jgi:multisubunit Na+/H+ antiporter MnhB subunit
MGYATNVVLSIPMAAIIYMLSEKMIKSLTYDNKFNDRIQKNFVMGFVVGMAFIALGMTLFAKKSNIDNQSLQFALYIAGGLLVLNSVFFSWNDLDEGTKIIILGISMVGLVIYTYRNK